ncbi:DoxX family membrane protein [Ruegeria sp. 2012CJ41-6]|uniref:DoxX family membrane protein n=1 Tax=Ruegeria spongiae TaxID=2942209 RepID=A0ABT0Q3P3_9RHOB|nr:DoxX family membrane protein [Ruegeria spongiae]MCL6284451.1 DoxX family membrane protein [Ruegeria spongiae]
MTALITLYNDVFDRFDRASDILVPTLARLVFIAIFLVYYWNSAMLKIDGSIFSPSAGAFGQMFPKAAEAVLYDISKITFFQRIVIFFGTVAEFALPALLLVGLLTRVTALGMIGFTWVQTLVDVNGHNIPFGGLFDNAITLADQRVMWTFLFLVIAIKGAGPLSLDRLLRLR